MTAGRVGMGLMFSPRGGSAQVARYLSRALGSAGWDVRLAAGSLGAAGEPTHAATFFRGLHVEPADYTPARERFEHGADHLAGPMPFHPSFEDREGAPDPVFAALGPEQTEAQIEAWAAVLERAGFADVDLIHLHHLTPMHEAVARRFPEHPVVTHLHGTDLKMLDRIGRLEAIARARGDDARRPRGQDAAARIGHADLGRPGRAARANEARAVRPRECVGHPALGGGRAQPAHHLHLAARRV